MASAGGIKAGRAYVEIAGDTSKLQRAANVAAKVMTDLGGKIRMMGLGVSAAGSAMAAPLILAVHQFEKMGSQLHDMAGRTGATVENLSQLAYAAGQTGSGVEDLEIGIKKMQKTLGDAAGGSQSAQDAIADLGLSVAKLGAMNPDQQFDAIAKRIGAIEDPTQRAAAALSVFGKSGTKLLPMIAEMAELRDEADRLNLTISKDMADRADAWGDAFGRVWATIKRLEFAIGDALQPILTRLADAISTTIAATTRWMDENQGVVIAAAAITAGVLVAGGALVTLGTALQVAGIAVAGFAKAFGVAWSVIGIAGKALALLVSPAGLVIAAITALGVAILYYTDVGADALKWLQDRFDELAGIVGTTLKAVAKALMSGNLAAAANVAFAGLRLAWLTGTRDIYKIWVDFTASFQAAWEIAAAWISTSWVKLFAFITKTTRETSSTVDGMLDVIGAGMASFANRLKFGTTQETQAAFDESLEQQLMERAGTRLEKDTEALDIIEQGRKSQIAEIEKRRDQNLAGIEGATADKMKAAKDALDKAGKDFAASVTEVHRLENAAPFKSRPTPKPGPDADGDGLRDKLQALDSALGQGGPRSTFGQERAAFSAENLDLEKKALDELKRIERNTRQAGGIRVV